MGGRKTLTLGLPALLLALVLGGVLYGLRQDPAPEEEAAPPPRTEAEVAAPERPLPEPPAGPPAGPPAVQAPEATPAQDGGLPPVPTAPAPEVRSRSLSSLRGSVSKALRSCSGRLTGGPVRVFVSMEVVVGGGRMQPARVQVRTSAPASDAFVRCVSEAVQAASMPAAAGEPDGSFPATVSLLSGGP